MIQLTIREWTFLTIVTEFIRTHGYSPSMREVAMAFGKVEGDGIRSTLQRLERKGVIRLKAHKAGATRTIRLVKGIKVAVAP